MQELVTIVLPIYNVEKYLDRCINSVISQTYENLEIILVDDGSPDNCPAMCDAWAEKDNRIRVIHKENAGLGMARNSGMEQATGKYICFFDSDDSVDSTVIEKCVASAEMHNSDVVCFSRHNIYDDGRVVSRQITTPTNLYNNKQDILSELLPGFFTYKYGFGVSVWSKMYKLSTLRDLGLSFKSEREIISEDAYFALELYSKVSTVSIVPECLYNYYKRGDSLSRSFKPGRQARNDDFLSKSLAFIADNGLPYDVSFSVMSRYHALTLGTMLQIMGSDLHPKQKKQEVWKIFKNSQLRDTLVKPAINLSAPTPRLFWRLLRCKCYFLCYLVLLKQSHR